MSAPVATRTASWYPADGLLPRGTVVLLPGRGEHPGVYERLGRRLSADAYVVHVLDPADADAGAGTGAWDTERTASDVVAAAQESAAPLVLAGSDSGALRALAVTAHPSVRPDGLLLVGTPTLDGGAPTDAGSASGWEDELSARTSCPTHRGRLDADPDFDRGALGAPIRSELVTAAARAVPLLGALPVLLLHGEDDPVTPVRSAHALAARLPGAALATVTGGRHDSLNDLAHRSVAATVVQWLERLRVGPDLPRLVTVHEPAGTV